MNTEDTKICCTCKTNKPLSEFHKDSTAPDGRVVKCKSCVREYQKEYNNKNREKHKAYCKQYREDNRERLDAAGKDYYQKNKEKRLAYRKQYREENREKVAASKKKYYEENKKEINTRKQEKETDESRLAKREYNRKYYAENKQKYIASNAKRKAVKRNATPSWLSPEQLQEIEDYYTVALLFKMYSGVEYHVDHIVPLRGKLVSGLHVPWNLQILTAKDNIKKRNNFEIGD